MRALPVMSLAVAIAALVLGVASANAGSGGVSPGGGGSDGGDGSSSGSNDGGQGRSGPCLSKREFGRRNLSLGDCGKDVKTLNWLLKSENFSAPLDQDFTGTTESSVRELERDESLPANGIVERETRKALVARVPKDRMSWYGPGFYGNRTACGQTLTRRTIGVAHRSLPCGTKVVLGYSGNWVRARVIDRGPYAKRRYTRDWDLTARTARKLEFEGVDRVRAGVIR